MDRILVTVTGIHDDTGEQELMLVDGLTHDEESRHVIFELPANMREPLSELLSKGQDINLTIAPGQIVRPGPSPEAEAFQKVAEDFLKQSAAIVPSITKEDQAIIDQMHVMARCVAEHERAMVPGHNLSDEEVFHIARTRRACEADWNAMLTKRVNDLARHYKGVL